MSVSEIFKLIGVVISGIKPIVVGVRTVATDLKEIKAACDTVPVGLFRSSKEKVEVLKQRVLVSEQTIGNLTLSVVDLETTLNTVKQRINTDFPKFKQLIVTYSDLKKDVAVGAAVANKVSEVIKFAPQIASTYVMAVIAPTQSTHTSIKNKVYELPSPDTAVLGIINEKLNRIDLRIRDLQRIMAKGGMQGIDVNAIEVADIFQEISESYTGVETELSKLLNNKILKELDPSEVSG